MDHLKVCVYAICKNEEKFIDRFMNAVSEADCIVVLDTGSTDHSFEKLKAYDIIAAQEEIIPWKFDVARNKALSMVPDDVDICISVDMDEVILPGWHQKLLDAWQGDATAAKCRFVWHFNKDHSEDGVFWPVRIHRRNDYTWTHSVHEVLTYIGKGREKIISINAVHFNHLPDIHKKRNYLTLLKRAVAEDPMNARDLFYLGREYMQYGDWKNCIATLNTYLSISKWFEERCAARRYIARSFLNLNQPSKAIDQLKSAISEAPYVREAYIDLAMIYYSQKDWKETASYIDAALNIPFPSYGFINEGYAWDQTPYDYGSIAHFHLGNLHKSLAYAQKCLEYQPDNKRYKDNVRFITAYIINSPSI